MANEGGRFHRKPLPMRFKPARCDSRFSPWNPVSRNDKPITSSAHYLARVTSSRTYDSDDGDAIVNDACITDDLTMTVSRRILSRHTSHTSDEDRYDRLVNEQDDFEQSDITDDFEYDYIDDDDDDDDDDPSEGDGDDGNEKPIEPVNNTGRLFPSKEEKSPAGRQDKVIQDGEKKDGSNKTTHDGKERKAKDERDPEIKNKPKMAKESSTQTSSPSKPSNNPRLAEFERALDEAVANDDQFLQMVREDRTRLSHDTKVWTDEYSLDDDKISHMAQKLMNGDVRHLYADLPLNQRRVVEETVSRMQTMSLQEILDSIAAD